MFRRPTIAVLSTGNEVHGHIDSRPGTKHGYDSNGCAGGQVYDYNTVIMMSLTIVMQGGGARWPPGTRTGVRQQPAHAAGRREGEWVCGY